MFQTKIVEKMEDFMPRELVWYVLLFSAYLKRNERTFSTLYRVTW
jgi:hypothetical protein